ncbi:ABC transporter ATP-binding protein [Lysinibacillus macroides]|uniref:ABC transporter ATP-binding protein n=1 Tax=Lysinibacillus macroides TaxID=33935 RepID=UPI001935C28B|nr:ABC transporter ATP-binding protein [Lysinibacillus macroides]
MSIEVSNVSKIIKGRTVLQNINFHLSQGKVYGFVGHNGSGKSMLFRIICGLVKPSTGTVKLFEDVLHKDISFPKSASVILEKPGFLEHYSGFLNLKFLAAIRNQINDQDIKVAIEQVGLDPTDQRPVKTYSLGMKQKLAIAQSIMEKPDIILLDEPMNGLDEDAVQAVYEIIKAEKQRGATILLTSHNKVDIESLCDQVYMLRDGVLTEKVI